MYVSGQCELSGGERLYVRMYYVRRYIRTPGWHGAIAKLEGWEKMPDFRDTYLYVRVRYQLHVLAASRRKCAISF